MKPNRTFWPAPFQVPGWKVYARNQGGIKIISALRCWGCGINYCPPTLAPPDYTTGHGRPPAGAPRRRNLRPCRWVDRGSSYASLDRARRAGRRTWRPAAAFFTCRRPAHGSTDSKPRACCVARLDRGQPHRCPCQSSRNRTVQCIDPPPRITWVSAPAAGDPPATNRKSTRLAADSTEGERPTTRSVFAGDPPAGANRPVFRQGQPGRRRRNALLTDQPEPPLASAQQEFPPCRAAPLRPRVQYRDRACPRPETSWPS